MKITYKGRRIVNIVMENVDMRDYPDFCDSYVESAEYADGTPLTEYECEELTEVHGNDLAHKSKF